MYDANVQVDPIKVFWMPGCSACVKVKEFLTGMGVPYESVNVLVDEKGMADLTSMGAQSVPVVSRGKDFVFAQNLDQVATFLGKKRGKAAAQLPPDVLIRRWLGFLAVAKSMIAEIPVDRLEYRPIPDRPRRSMRELAYHVFQIPEVFLGNIAGEFEDWAYHINLPTPDDIVTFADILAYADRIEPRLVRWWTDLGDKRCEFLVKTYYGARPAAELLERQTWHSAQHTRQLQYVLEGLSVLLSRKVAPEAYAGLPMPDGIWE
jgi:glutaredoxin